MSRYYTKTAHDEALKQHDLLWDRMREVAAEHGRDSDEYRKAHAAVVESMKLVRAAARRPKRPKR